MKKTLFIVILCILLCSCTPPEKAESVTVFAMDTVMTVTAYGKGAGQALINAEKELYRLDKLWSVTNPESEISKLNSRKSTTVSPDTAEVISIALKMSELTDGAFDISIYPCLKKWGFTDKNYRVPSESEIRESLKLCDYSQIAVSGNNVYLPEGCEIDLGGIAKGFAADRIYSILKQSGIENAIISLGGNVSVLDKKPDGSPWNIQIKNSEIILKIENKSVVTSGNYQRYFTEGGKTYHHIIDPKTGYPADTKLTSVTVIAESSTEADALSTALYVMGEKEALSFLKKNPQYDAVFLHEDNSVTTNNTALLGTK